MVLLVGAGLLGKSFYRLLHVDPGLQPDNLATLILSAPNTNYSKNPQAIALERQVLDRVSILPGVTSVSIANKLPVGTVTSPRASGSWAGRTTRNIMRWAYRQVSPGYFKTLQARLLEGRYFTSAKPTYQYQSGQSAKRCVKVLSFPPASCNKEAIAS
jgi:hypothetical protein